MVRKNEGVTNALAYPTHDRLHQYLIETLRFSHQVLPGTSYYVASFSKEGDLLSQWRAYCRAGGGYSIGFDADELKAAARENANAIDSPFPWRLLRCEYDEMRQKEVLDGFLREARQAFDQLDANDQRLYLEHAEKNKAEIVVPWHAEYPLGTDYPTWLTQRAKAYMTAVNEVAPAFKAWAFREEREWRVVSPLVYGGSTVEEYRAGKYFPIPYIKFELPRRNGRLHVRKIIVGPTENPELSFATAQRICLRYKIDVDSWAMSDVPFRHWDSK